MKQIFLFFVCTFLGGIANISAQQHDLDKELMRRTYEVIRQHETDSIDTENAIRMLAEIHRQSNRFSSACLPYKSFTLNTTAGDMCLLNDVRHNSSNCVCLSGLNVGMTSNDKQCIVYVDLLNRSAMSEINDNVHPNSAQTWAARSVRCNKEGISMIAHPHLTKSLVDEYSAGYIKAITDKSWIKESGLDTVFVATIPCRDSLAMLDIQNREVVSPIHVDYPFYYEVTMFKREFQPLRLRMFLTKKGEKTMDKYLECIAQSFSY